jgi:hypothetical protein
MLSDASPAHARMPKGPTADAGGENGGSSRPVPMRVHVRAVVAAGLRRDHFSLSIRTMTEPPRTGARIY